MYLDLMVRWMTGIDYMGHQLGKMVQGDSLGLRFQGVEGIQLPTSYMGIQK
jgi:hypothetical protein